MIKQLQAFKFEHDTIIEKLTVEPPLKNKMIFHSEGCFIHLKGSPVILQASEESTKLQGKENILLNCGTYFVNWIDRLNTRVDVIVIHLHPNLIKYIYGEKTPLLYKQHENKNQIQNIAPSDTITKFLESLEFYFENPHLVNNELLKLKIKELILLLLQTENSKTLLEIFQKLYAPKVANIKKVVDFNLYSNLSVSELAALCNMSTSKFKREFKTIFNSTPKKYLTAQKLERAKELLKHSTKSISEIAFKIGFNDPNYFTRVFSSQNGISPSEFKNQF